MTWDADYYMHMALDAGARFAGDAERRWFRIRIESSHDMRHVLTGYRPDVLGEACLLSFRFGQLRHTGVLVLTLFGILQARLKSRGPILGPIIEAYRRGRRANQLDTHPWEDRLEQSLAIQRVSLNLQSPRLYPSPFAPEAYIKSETSATLDTQTQALNSL